MVGGKIKPRTPNYTRPAPALPMQNTEEEKNTAKKYKMQQTQINADTKLQPATVLSMQKYKNTNCTNIQK